MGMEAFDELLSINVPWIQKFPGVRVCMRSPIPGCPALPRPQCAGPGLGSPAQLLASRR